MVKNKTYLTYYITKIFSFRFKKYETNNFTSIKMNKIKLSIFFITISVFIGFSTAQTFGLQVNDNQITYQKDSKGNSILDFSYCGYKSSEQNIPALKNVIFVPKQDADASDVIQRAINYVSALKPDANGFRGAILLDNGTFHLNRNLWISTSGVVLRGTNKHQTILLKHGVDRSALIYIEGVNNCIDKDTFKITSDYVPVNEKTFLLNSVSGLKIGDRIKITRPSTKEWIASVKCDVYGGGISALGWKPKDIDITWDRTIVAITTNSITIDVPLTTAIDAKFGGGKITKYEWNGRISNSGIENLTLISDYDKKYPKDEDHCWTGISIDNAENCWIRQINFKHFAGNAVILQPNSSKITVEDCISKEPISEIGGFRRITFYTLGQQNIVQRCYSEDGINDFAAGFCAPGPNAFVQCEAKRALGFSGSISSWASGLLFDIVSIDGHNLSFKNLGQSKNGAGWNTSNSLFWQCSAAEIECYSPSEDAKNRAYGCWAQFSGDGEWMQSDNHVQPRSIFYAQLNDRLKQNVENRGRILPMSTDGSSSPTVEQAQKMMKDAYEPLLTLENWIDQATFSPSVENTNIFSVNSIKEKTEKKVNIISSDISIQNGKIVNNGALIVGSKIDVPWWSGKLRTSYINSSQVKSHITRFVPGREGKGFTDRIDTVISSMRRNKVAVLDHNYGLWYDRRRDDHERIRRRDGDVWAPFYEQPFARSGQETAWDGLSKYDLNRPNAWYWYRLKEFADKGEQKGLLLFHENFFQHNIIEAGAHWVDCPWRDANNINHLGFPEPVNFTGDKRIFRSEMFYDISNSERKSFYRNYIRQSLNTFADNKNVVQLISAEYTGPLHFVQFWLDVIDEWEKETGKKTFVALSTTKDVQDAILADTKRASVVDIIDIRYWHKKADNTFYEPKGGLNLAPRQHARLMKVGSVSFDAAYDAISEYKTKYPEKAVTYYAQNYPEMAWAVLMAGGSCPVLVCSNQEFLKAVSEMNPKNITSSIYKQIEKTGKGAVIYVESIAKISLQLEPGKYELSYIDNNSGEIKIIGKNIPIKGTYTLDAAKTGAYWFRKL